MKKNIDRKVKPRREVRVTHEICPRTVPMEARAFVIFLFRYSDEVEENLIPPNLILVKVADCMSYDVTEMGKHNLAGMEDYLKLHNYKKWW